MRDMSSVLTNLGGVRVDASGAIETGWAGKGARLSACRRFVKGLEPFSTGVEAAPARSPTRPPDDNSLWEVGWGSGPVPRFSAHRKQKHGQFPASRSEEPTSEPPSLMRSSYDDLCMKQNTQIHTKR